MIDEKIKGEFDFEKFLERQDKLEEAVKELSGLVRELKDEIGSLKEKDNKIATHKVNKSEIMKSILVFYLDYATTANFNVKKPKKTDSPKSPQTPKINKKVKKIDEEEKLNQTVKVKGFKKVSLN